MLNPAVHDSSLHYWTHKVTNQPSVAAGILGYTKWLGPIVGLSAGAKAEDSDPGPSGSIRLGFNVGGFCCRFCLFRTGGLGVCLGGRMKN